MNTLLMRLCFSLLMLFVSQTALAQPDSVWSRTFGGVQNDLFNAVAPRDGGGFFCAGQTQESGGQGWLVCTDANGGQLWNVTSGYASDDAFSAVAAMPDSGCVAAGKSFASTHGWNGFLVRWTALGDTLWTRKYGGMSRDEFAAVAVGTDGSIVCAGYTNSFGAQSGDFWLMKVSAQGDSLWNRRFGGPNPDYCYALTEVADGWLLAGSSESYGGSAGAPDFWLLKVNQNGDSLWSRTYGGDGNDVATGISSADSSGFVLCGYSDSFDAHRMDMWLVQANLSGDSLRSRMLGYSQLDFGFGITRIPGGFVAVGIVDRGSGGGGFNLWNVGLTDSLTLLWNDYFEGPVADEGRAVCAAPDGGFVLAGGTYSFGAGGQDGWVVRMPPVVIGLEAQPPELDFGNAELGRATGRNLILHNSGNVTVEISNVLINAPYTTSFIPPVTLHPGNESMISVEVTPTALGPLLDTLRVLTNVLPGPLNVPVLANGAMMTAVNISPQPCNFGSCLLGDSSSLSVRVTNSGIVPVQVESFTASAPFRVEATAPFTLDPQQQYNFVVWFRPTEQRSYDEILRIYHNASPTPATTGLLGTGVPNAVGGNDDALPARFALGEAYPNPFNAETLLPLELPQAARIQLTLLDATGREVRTLVEETLPSGRHSVRVAAGDLASGVYFARLESPAGFIVRRLVLLK